MKKFATTYLLLLASLLLLSACAKNDDNPFDASPSERLDKATIAYRNTLASAEHGWQVSYFPGQVRQYGGINFVMKFTNNDIVNVYSEKADDTTEPVTSLYALKKDLGAVLSFDSYNKLFHYFSSPDVSQGAGKGKGFEGDYEFIFKSTPQEQDHIVLEGKKTHNIMRLTRLKEPQGDYLKDILKIGGLFPNHIGYTMDCEGKPFFVALNVASRNFKFKQKIDDPEVSVPFLTTDNSIRFYEPLEIDGKVYYELFVDKENRAFASKDGGLKIVSESKLSFDISTPWRFQFTAENAAPSLIDIYNSVNERHKLTVNAQYAMKPTISMRKNQIVVPLGQYTAAHPIKWLPFSGGLLVVEAGARPTSGNWRFVPYYNDLLNIFTSNSPFILENMGEKVKFTSRDNEDVWFVLDKGTQ